VPLAEDHSESARILEEFRPLLESNRIEKVGHNLKFDIGVLLWHGIRVQGPLFDTMIAHSLIEPDMRHGMDYLSEVYLGYSPVPITRLIGERNAPQISMREVELDQISEYAAEDADVTWQLCAVLKPLLKDKGQEKVFYEIETPLIPVLAAMEVEGIRLDPGALKQASAKLASDIARYEQKIHELAGRPFNINSPKQLGEILFDVLKLGTKPKKTRTGQYSTNEQTLQTLASKHPIVQLILDHRAASKLKSTYVDMLPNALFEKTGRIHTSFGQVMTATGRLQSQDPNLQNIPIRTDQGREIRKAFTAKNQHYQLLSADYSQIELRIIAALSRDPAMTQAFADNLDIHAATAAKIYNLDLESVNDEMRRMAKTVNFGLIYGMSAFGLAQRLGIPRADANTLIEQYFRQFPGVRRYMDQSIEFAQKHGYVQTVTGRRRYLRDINSANATVRSAAERNAINAPIQGTAADMIKLAMIRIHNALQNKQLRTRMILQIHDELLFDMPKSEQDSVLPLVEEHMKSALPLPGVPVVVEMGVGRTWLEAH
jgi:DNA polymerase-1